MPKFRLLLYVAVDGSHTQYNPLTIHNQKLKLKITLPVPKQYLKLVRFVEHYHF